MKREVESGRKIAAAACLILAMTAPGVRAQVIAVGDDGSAQTLCTAFQNPQPHRVTHGPTQPIPSAYQAMIVRAAETYNMAPDLLDALARQESGYNPRAHSPKGAIGIMQLMPATAKALNVDPWDPQQNILGGAAVLRQELDAFDGHLDLALAAYNAGQGAVVRYGGIPPYKETRAYVGQNIDKLAQKSEGAGAPVSGESEAAPPPVVADSYIQKCQ